MIKLFSSVILKTVKGIKFYGGAIMAHIITDACIACGACQPECPVNCISEGAIYEIDHDQCIDCGACSSVCPTGAAQPEA